MLPRDPNVRLNVDAAAGVSWLVNGRVLDMSTGQFAKRNLRVENGRITEVTGEPAPLGATTNLAGSYVVPGLINCHTHLQGQYPYSKRRENEHPGVTAIRAASRARKMLVLGVTTVRCLHEQSRADIAVRAAADAGWATAPRIFAAGRALTTPDGHGAGLGCAVARGPEGFLSAATAELQAGADHVKVFLSGGLARIGEDLDNIELDADELHAVVRAAAAHNSYVVAHTAGSSSIALGLECGVRSFEHAYRLDRDTAVLMAAAEVFLTPTLAVTHSPNWQAAVGFTEIQRARSAAVREEHEQSIRLAIEQGVRIVAGTDFPAEAIEDGVPLINHELALLTELGMSPLDALRAATSTAAELVNLPDEIGQVAEGFQADLLIVDRDPTADITALTSPRQIFAGGLEVHRYR